MSNDKKPSDTPGLAKWEILAAKKVQETSALIPSEWQIDQSHADKITNLVDMPYKTKFFTQEELKYTDTSASELVKKLRSGEWSSESVTRAFCKRAAVAHQLFNCLSEIMFDTAIQDAKRLDEHLRERGPVGPLHGLPISLKDNLHVKGKDSTIGFVSLIDKPADRDSPLVEMLRTAGAVVYVKTQTPTAMMIAETVNNICKVVHNPLKRGVTCGGSSGGEASLIAFGGSPLGVGSDIGGSLRIPASCCGIFTIRPSFGRFPTLYTQSGLAGQVSQ
jgi:amidase